MASLKVEASFAAHPVGRSRVVKFRNTITLGDCSSSSGRSQSYAANSRNLALLLVGILNAREIVLVGSLDLWVTKCHGTRDSTERRSSAARRLQALVRHHLLRLCGDALAIGVNDPRTNRRVQASRRCRRIRHQDQAAPRDASQVKFYLVSHFDRKSPFAKKIFMLKCVRSRRRASLLPPPPPRPRTGQDGTKKFHERAFWYEVGKTRRARSSMFMRLRARSRKFDCLQLPPPPPYFTALFAAQRWRASNFSSRSRKLRLMFKRAPFWRMTA